MTFGFAPHFSSLLYNAARTSKVGYVLLFDETLNKKSQLKQMDFHIRHWDESTLTVKTRFLTSKFIGHTKAVDLQEQFDEVTSEIQLPKAKLLQISMDGPAVNWSMYNKINCAMKEEMGVALIHTGSCGLHIVHNAFRKGCDASTWQLDAFLSATYNLFKDCPARRDDFSTVTGSQSFPPKFCSHRWLENASVASAVLQQLPSLGLFAKAAVEKRVTLPTCKSFETVKNEVHKPLLPCQLAFFASVAKELEPFLSKYQTDKPLIAFLGTELHRIILNLMQRFMKPSALLGCSNSATLMEVKVENTEHHLSLSQVELGFQTRSLLQKAQREALLSDKAVNLFKLDCKRFLIGVVSKLVEKCPLKYGLVRNLSCLNPKEMVNSESCSRKIKKVLQCFIDANRLSSEEGDIIVRQYTLFLTVTATASGANEFDCKTDRLDTWLYNALANNEDYANLWAFVQQVLILSHGQATVERGFSFNKSVLTDNLSKQALVARRIILDHIRDAGGVTKVNLSKPLLVSAGSAWRRYNQFLDAQRKEKEGQERQDKKRKLEEEITSIRKKKKTAEEDSRHLLREADTLSFKAQE